MVLNIKSQTELSGFYVVFNRTIINEKSGIYGISHLIEHLISHNFNDSLIEEFQSDGIIWNAYTSPTNMVFYMMGLDKHISKYKNKFLENLSYLDVSDDNFEIEKNSLLEEYTALFNIQSSSHLLNLYRKLFNSYNTIGKKEDIINITKKDCYEHREKYYINPSKIINVSKNSPFNTDIVFNNNDNNFSVKYDFNENMKYEKYISMHKSSIIYASPIIENDWASVFFINYILSNGLSSILYKNIRKKSGLVYYIKCNIDRMSDMSGINIISTETDNNKVYETMDNLNKTLKDKSFLTQEKFNNVKNSIINKIDTININRHNNIESFIKPDKWAIEKQIYNITLDNIIDIYDKYFDYNNFHKSIDKKEF